MSHYERHFHRTEPIDLRRLPFAPDVDAGKADRTVFICVLIVGLLALIFTPWARAQQASATPCELGGMLAYHAYIWAVPDAAMPDSLKLHYAVDYWGDSLIIKHDRAVAHRGADYIAARLKPTGMRKPWDGAAYEATREFIVKECGK